MEFAMSSSNAGRSKKRKHAFDDGTDHHDADEGNAGAAKHRRLVEEDDDRDVPDGNEDANANNDHDDDPGVDDPGVDGAGDRSNAENRRLIEQDAAVLYGGEGFEPFEVGPPTPDQVAFQKRCQASFELNAKEIYDERDRIVRLDPPTDHDPTTEGGIGADKHLPLCLEVARLMDLNSFRYETEGRVGWIMGCGDNEFGTLGRHLPGTTQNATTGIRLLNPNLFDAKIRQISCGAMMSAALSIYGVVYTFGQADNGSLGRKLPPHVDPDHSELWEVTPAPLDGDPPGIRQVACGNQFGLCLTETGIVFSWGCYEDKHNQRFRITPSGGGGANHPAGCNEKPVQVPGLSNIIEIYTGSEANFGFALALDGTLCSLGFGNCGELGRIALYDPKSHKPSAHFGLYSYEKDGEKCINESVLKEFLVPRPVPLPSKKVLSVACGEDFAVVVARNDDNVGITYSAGNNGFGQLGDGSASVETNQLEFRPIQALERANICKVAAGTRHGLALSQDMNTIYAWGAADKGQLGLGVEATLQVSGYVATPTICTFYGRNSPCQIVDIACGPNYSMALSLEGDVYTWGYTDGRDKMFTGHAAPDGEDVYVPLKLEMRAPTVERPMEALQMAGGAHGPMFLVQRRADDDDNNNETNVG